MTGNVTISKQLDKYNYITSDNIHYSAQKPSKTSGKWTLLSTPFVEYFIKTLQLYMWHFYSTIFIDENGVENAVCKMSAILSEIFSERVAAKKFTATTNMTNVWA